MSDNTNSTNNKEEEEDKSKKEKQQENYDPHNSLWRSIGSDTTTSSGFGGLLSMGEGTYQVSMSDLFVANRQKLVSQLQHQASASSGVVYLEGGKSTTRYDSDHEPIFRQESYFLYLFGVKEPDCAACIDISTGKTTLFIPKLPEDYAIIMGRIKSRHEFQVIYHVDHVEYIDEVEDILYQQVTEQNNMPTSNGSMSNGVSSNGAHHQSGEPKLLLMKGTNSDSGKDYEPPSQFLDDEHKLHKFADTDTLFPVLAECRVHKSPAELQILRRITEVTSYGHAYVMRNIKPQMMEYQGESLFRHYCYYNYGCRLTGYTPICACGPNASVLHYGHTGEPNTRQIQPGEICLFDLGVEYNNLGGYGSDVTCSYPINGKFTQKQAGIYTAVLNAQKAVYKILKPGVSWVECHKTAEEAILKQLITIGIVQIPAGETTTIRDLVELRLGAVFMPHGLGHFIGIDTHDVGGYLSKDPQRIVMPGLKSLRTARIIEEHMTLTVEPGCYFINHLLDRGISDDSPFCKYLNADLINNEYRNFGGVRLEDVVAITSDGFTNFTLCPRAIQEVEDIMSGDGSRNKWPPIKDMAPELHRDGLTQTTTRPPKPSPPSL